MIYYLPQLQQAEETVLAYLFYATKTSELLNLLKPADFICNKIKDESINGFIFSNLKIKGVMYWPFKNKALTKATIEAISNYKLTITGIEAFNAYQFMVEYKIGIALFNKLNALQETESIIFNQIRKDALEFLAEDHSVSLWDKVLIIGNELLKNDLFTELHPFIKSLYQNINEKMNIIRAEQNQHKQIIEFLKLEINANNKNYEDLRNIQKIFKTLYYDSTTPENFRVILANLVELLANGCLKHQQAELLKLHKEISQ